MAEMKEAMEALKQAAAADARFKSALKVDAGGDAGKLQSVLDNFVVAMDLLEKAQAAETKDKTPLWTCSSRERSRKRTRLQILNAV